MKAFFFDIDGTLLDAGKQITDPSDITLTALKQLKTAGHKIFIATGRPISYINQSILSVGFDGIVASNGSYVTCQGTEIYQKQIDSAFQKVLTNCADENHVVLFLEGQTCSYHTTKRQDLVTHFLSYFDLSNRTIRPVDFEAGMQINKICYLIDEKSNLAPLQALLKDEFIQLPYPGGQGGDFYYKENNKATGIAKILDQLQIDVADTIAFGDAENDIEMLQFVGTGIAMGNCQPALKEYADQVIGCVEDNAIATYLNQTILNTQIVS